MDRVANQVRTGAPVLQWDLVLITLHHNAVLQWIMRGLADHHQEEEVVLHKAGVIATRARDKTEAGHLPGAEGDKT
jgi:hypothetical protein